MNLSDLEPGQTVRCQGYPRLAAPEVGRVIAIHECPDYTVAEIDFPDFLLGHSGTSGEDTRTTRLYLTGSQILEVVGDHYAID